MNTKYSRKTSAELSKAVIAYMTSYSAELICARQIWYEGMESHGTPTPEELAVIEEALSRLEGWKAIGLTRHEKFGTQITFKRIAVQADLPVEPGKIMVQHLFKVGSRYKTPDGTIYQIVLSEVYNLRCFEVKDGKLVGGMIKIHPASDYAKSLVEC